MRRSVRLLIAAVVSVQFLVTSLLAQTPAQSSAAARIDELPAALQARARAVLAEPDEDTRADLIEDLIEADPAGTLEFVLALLEEESSADVREDIIDELEDVPDPRVGPALERRVLHDPDTGIAIAALELLRVRATDPLLELLEQRIRTTRASGDTAQLTELAAEQERWTTIIRGGLLPTFLQEPPPVFAAAPADRPVRVLGFGDFGDGSEAQRTVAAAMRAYHAKNRFDFAVTLGDNFYSIGMASPQDERWKTWWSDLYDPLGIPFYATLGNHDWGQPNSPAAEILFSRKSPSWRMPAAYYTFTAGAAQFFALDTDVISEKQLLWLTAALDASPARWKIVYGHHPIYSHGQHEDSEEHIERLLPALRDRADVYLAGHDHDMQHLRPEGRLHFFVAGTGGKLRPIEPGPRSLFARSARGFAVLEIAPASLNVAFVDATGAELYRYAITDSAPLPPSREALTVQAPDRERTSGDKRILLIADKPSHGPLQHEHNAGVWLLQKWLQTVPGVSVTTSFDGWPQDASRIETADGIFLFCTGGNRHYAFQEDRAAALQKAAARGAGLMFMHYCVEPPADRGRQEMLDWIGGYFEIHHSVNPHWDADFTTLPDHPITRGVNPFRLRDEWYYNMRFRPDMRGITPILTAVPGPETLTRPDGPHSGNPDVRAKAGQPHTVMWASERPGGGRGVGMTGGHFHVNFGNDDFRKAVLNAILWIARAEVPPNGVDVRLAPGELQERLDPKPPRRQDQP